MAAIARAFQSPAFKIKRTVIMANEMGRITSTIHTGIRPPTWAALSSSYRTNS